MKVQLTCVKRSKAIFMNNVVCYNVTRMAYTLVLKDEKKRKKSSVCEKNVQNTENKTEKKVQQKEQGETFTCS